MKLKILGTVLLLFSLLGCGPTITHVPKMQHIASLDFTKYQKDGFLITPGEYGENYEALGLFSFILSAEANLVSKDEMNRFRVWEIEEIKPQEILDIACDTAVEKGADAITHFTIKNGTKTMHDGESSFTINTIEISGLLIKRK